MTEIWRSSCGAKGTHIRLIPQERPAHILRKVISWSVQSMIAVGILMLASQMVILSIWIY
jgi:hypothetical protein